MEFQIKGPFRDNFYNLMRKVGYHFLYKDEKTGEVSFVRPPQGYPRFHIYLRAEKDILIFNLHLDQKKPIYKGVAAHNGEYDGELVEQEAKRVKQLLE